MHKWGRCCTVRGTEYPLPPRQHLHLGCEGQHLRRAQVGEVLHSGEGQRIPPPTQATAAFCDVGDSIPGVHKWGSCCTVEGDRRPLPPRQQLHLGCGGQHPKCAQVGEVLQGGKGQSGPSKPGSSSNWGVGDSILGVHKWGRRCKVEMGRAAPPSQAAAAFWVWGTAS